MNLSEDIISDERCLFLTGLIKKSNNRDCIRIIRNLLNAAYEKATEELQNNNDLPQPSDYTNNKITLEEDLP